MLLAAPDGTSSATSAALGGLRLDEIETFVVLAEELHFSRAAQRLFMSQSGLSRRIAHFEIAVGEAVFRRTTRSVALTEHGAAILPSARSVLNSAVALRRSSETVSLPLQPGR